MMGEKKKAILLGDYSSPKWHPLKGVDEEICHILEEQFTVLCTEDYGTLTGEYLKTFDLCIFYVDCWEEKTSPGLVNAVLSYVSGGGGLLVIHNGILVHSNYELVQMIGAKFAGHPEYSKLEYVVKAPEHAIMAGIGEFEIEDEPYRFEFDNLTEKTMLMEYKFEGEMWPAGWAHKFGMGRVAYLAPGHSVSSFKNDAFRGVILRSGLWVCGDI